MSERDSGWFESAGGQTRFEMKGAGVWIHQCDSVESQGGDIVILTPDDVRRLPDYVAPAPDTRTLAEVRASVERDRARLMVIRAELGPVTPANENAEWALECAIDHASDVDGFCGRAQRELAALEAGR